MLLLNLILRCLFFGFVVSISPVIADPAVLYRAEYVAEYQGLPVKAKGIRELVRLDNDRYRLISSAKSVLVRVTESTEFEMDDTGLSPIDYSYTREGLGKNKRDSSHFDWETGIIEHDGTTSALAAGTLDKLSYQYKLRADVADSLSRGDEHAILEYVIADEEKRKHYQFQIGEEEYLQTPIGELRTIRIDRVRADSDRQTSLWLATDYEFLLVKLKQIENNRGFELNLNAASINGKSI